MEGRVCPLRAKTSGRAARSCSAGCSGDCAVDCYISSWSAKVEISNFRRLTNPPVAMATTDKPRRRAEREPGDLETGRCGSSVRENHAAIVAGRGMISTSGIGHPENRGKDERDVGPLMVAAVGTGRKKRARHHHWHGRGVLSKSHGTGRPFSPRWHAHRHSVSVFRFHGSGGWNIEVSIAILARRKS